MKLDTAKTFRVNPDFVQVAVRVPILEEAEALKSFRAWAPVLVDVHVPPLTDPLSVFVVVATFNVTEHAAPSVTFNASLLEPFQILFVGLLIDTATFLLNVGIASFASPRVPVGLAPLVKVLGSNEEPTKRTVFDTDPVGALMVMFCSCE